MNKKQIFSLALVLAFSQSSFANLLKKNIAAAQDASQQGTSQQGANEATTDQSSTSQSSGSTSSSDMTSPSASQQSQSGSASGSMAQQSGGQVQTVDDVQTLNKGISNYDNKKVKVTGEIKDKLDKRSFVLEGGGIMNDEIVVVVDPKVQGQKTANVDKLKENAKIEVTGTVKAVPVASVREELSWDLDPKIEVELEGVTGVLVAETIAKK